MQPTSSPGFILVELCFWCLDMIKRPSGETFLGGPDGSFSKWSSGISLGCYEPLCPFCFVSFANKFMGIGKRRTGRRSPKRRKRYVGIVVDAIRLEPAPTQEETCSQLRDYVASYPTPNPPDSFTGVCGQTVESALVRSLAAITRRHAENSNRGTFLFEKSFSCARDDRRWPESDVINKNGNLSDDGWRNLRAA